MGIHHHRSRGAVLVATLALLVIPAAGCAAADPAPLGAGPQSAASSAAPATSPTRGEENPADMTDPKPVGTEKTLRGTLRAGVEANCILLAAEDGQSYLLIGGDRQLLAGGGRVEVRGQLQPDLMTTCQQGIPVTVSTVRRI